MDLGNFWISVRHEFPQLFQQAIHVLLPFVTTYLCESSFSSQISIKNKQRSGLKSVEHEPRVCLSDIQSRITTICARIAITSFPLNITVVMH